MIYADFEMGDLANTIFGVSSALDSKTHIEFLCSRLPIEHNLSSFKDLQLVFKDGYRCKALLSVLGEQTQSLI